MKILRKNLKRIIYLLLLLIILFNTIGITVQKVFATITNGTYLARIYETAYTDNTGQNIFKIRVEGDEIPKLTDTRFWTGGILSKLSFRPSRNVSAI